MDGWVVAAGVARNVLVVVGWNGYSAFRPHAGLPRPRRGLDGSAVGDVVLDFYLPYGARSAAQFELGTPIVSNRMGRSARAAVTAPADVASRYGSTSATSAKRRPSRSTVPRCGLPVAAARIATRRALREAGWRPATRRHPPYQASTARPRFPGR